MWGQVVHYRCRKQSITATSTFDSELRALFECIERANQLRASLVQMGIISESEPIIVRCDNASTVKTLKNPLGTDKVGHIEFEDTSNIDTSELEFDLQKYLADEPYQTHKLQEKLILSRVMEMVEKEQIIVSHVPGAENIADLETKCLPLEKFYYCVTRCMCLNIQGKGRHVGGICDCVELPDLKKLREDRDVIISDEEVVEVFNCNYCAPNVE
jgi:hypothetical protein